MGPEGHTPHKERTEMGLLAAGHGSAKVVALILAFVAAYYLHKNCRFRPT
jgi:hypothetical protein